MSEQDTIEETDGHIEEEFTFAKNPEFKVDYKGECAYEVAVTVPAENMAKQAEELYNELKEDAELPGFRRGKAPVKLIENKFAKVVRGESVQKLVSASFQKLIKDEDLHPIDMPDVDGLEDLDEMENSDPLKFTLKFEVAPRCEIGNYKGLEVERPILKVGKKQIDEAIKQVQERVASFEPLGAAGKAKEGDQVVIDFAGTIEGEAFEGGTAENYPYILGSNRFLPEFEEALKGVKAGAEITCPVVFPEDYGHDELKGKDAEFKITVHEIKRKSAPEVNDDLAKSAGYEDLKDMNAKIKDHLVSGAKEQSDRVTESRAINQVIDNSTFEIPKSLIESSANSYTEQEVRRLVDMRVPAGQIEESIEDIRKNSFEIAENNIKGLVILNKIGETENIEVTDEDFEKEAAAIQTRTGMDMKVVNQFLNQDDKRSEYESRIYRQKAGAVIIENAKVTEKEVTQEELDKQDEEVSVDED